MFCTSMYLINGIFFIENLTFFREIIFIFFFLFKILSSWHTACQRSLVQNFIVSHFMKRDFLDIYKYIQRQNENKSKRKETVWILKRKRNAFSNSTYIRERDKKKKMERVRETERQSDKDKESKKTRVETQYLFLV